MPDDIISLREEAKAIADGILALLEEREANTVAALSGMASALAAVLAGTAEDHDHLAEGLSIAVDQVACQAGELFSRRGEVLGTAKPEGSA